VGGPCAPKSGGVSPQEVEEIRNAIRKKYAAVSVSTSGKFLYPTGRDGARVLGYDPAILEDSASGLLQSFCGVGNPFSLGKIRPGDRVLDIGCGAGFDLFVASLLVGEAGLVCGVDLTDEMTKKAAENLAGAGLINFEVRKVDSESIPYDDDFFDVVISNGVINLSPDKEALFKEVYRVLKPGGKIQFADIVLENVLPAGMRGSLEAWSQ